MDPMHPTCPPPPAPLHFCYVNWMFGEKTSAIESFIHRGVDKHKEPAAIVSSARFIPRDFYKATQNRHIELHGN